MLVTLISLFCLAEPLHWGFSTHSPERFADENVGGGLIFDGASKPIYIDDKAGLAFYNAQVYTDVVFFFGI